MAAMTAGSAMVGAPPYGPEKLNTFVSTRTAIEAVTLRPALSVARIRMLWSPSARMSCFAVAVPTVEGAAVHADFIPSYVRGPLGSRHCNRHATVVDECRKRVYRQIRPSVVDLNSNPR